MKPFVRYSRLLRILLTFTLLLSMITTPARGETSVDVAGASLEGSAAGIDAVSPVVDGLEEAVSDEVPVDDGPKASEQTVPEEPPMPIEPPAVEETPILSEPDSENDQSVGAESEVASDVPAETSSLGQAEPAIELTAGPQQLDTVVHPTSSDAAALQATPEPEGEVVASAIADPMYFYSGGNVPLETILDATSINDHTQPALLWTSGDLVYMAVKSTHEIVYMTLQDVTRNPLHMFDPWVNIFVNDVEYAPTGLGGNTKDAHWTIIAFPVTLIDFSMPLTYSYYVKGIGGGHDVSGTFTVEPPLVSLSLTKTWSGGTMPPAEISITRQVMGGSIESVGTYTLTPDEPVLELTGLLMTDALGRPYQYSAAEIDSGTGYEFSVVSSYDGTAMHWTLVATNTYTSPKIDITGQKVWNGGPSPRPTVQLQLLRDGEPFGEAVDLVHPDLTYTWTVDETDSDGAPYTYTVVEVGEIENYSTEASGTVVTNTYVPPIRTFTGYKQWQGGTTPRPDVELQLYQRLTPYGDSVILSDGESEYTWTNLPATDFNGTPYTYSVREVDPPPGYEATHSEDGTTITNIFEPEKRSVTGRKLWEGGPTPRPDIQLRLYRYIAGSAAEAEPVGEIATLSDGDIAYTWTGLDRTDFYGATYIYYVDEVEAPENYRYSIGLDRLTVLNTYHSPQVVIEATKVWQGGVEPRPEIQFQLYRDNQPFGDAKTLVSGETTVTWTVDETDFNGAPYTYTVREVETPAGYLSDVVASSDTSFTVINSEAPLGVLNLTKALFSNSGAPINLSRDFRATVFGPSYPDGRTVTINPLHPVQLTNLEYGEYTLEETATYDADYTVVQPDPVSLSFGSREATLTVSNTERALGSLLITKVHEGATGDPLDPDEEFTITLYGPEYPLGHEMTISVNKPIELSGLMYGDYWVDEDVPDNYRMLTSGVASLSVEHKYDEIAVVNMYRPPMIDVEATKVWEGGTAPRPSVEFQLLRSTEASPTPVAVGDPITLPDGSTVATWTVPATDANRNPYTYSVEEVNDPLEGYLPPVVEHSSDTTFTITNKEAPLGRLALVKVLTDAAGDPIEEGRSFDATVTGPSYPDGESVTLDSAEPLVLTDLIYGTYTVSEDGYETDYIVTNPAAGVELDFASREGTLTVENRERPLGQLTIVKVLTDAAGDPIEESRSFDATVTGPSYPDGKSVTLDSAEPLVLTDLIYGTYTVSEDGYETDYIVTNPAAGVELDFASREGTLTVENRERPLGQLTIVKVHEGATGDPLDSDQEFSITVTGPSYPTGHRMTITSGASETLNNLEYGTYYVEEEPVDNYQSTVSPEVELSIISKVAMITVTNTYVPPKIDIEATKVWEGGITPRPEVQFQLMRSTEASPTPIAVGDAVTLEDGTTVVKWTVDATDANRNPYTYTVEEVNDPLEGYLPPLVEQSSDTTFTITNKEAPLGRLALVKKLYEADWETLIDESRSFEATLTGPSYPDGEPVTLDSANPVVFTGLEYGEYTLTEDDRYIGDYFIGSPATGTIDFGSRDATLTIENRERALGKLTIIKEVYSDAGDPIDEERTFSAILTGPSYPDGEEIEINSATPTTIPNLIYGTYTLAEVENADYTIAIDVESVDVSIDAKEAAFTVTNTERALGELTLVKVHVGATGDPLDADQEFSFTVTGPSYPDGHEVVVSAGTPVVLDGLIYGEYSVTEDAVENYATTITAPVSLSIGGKIGQITVTNTYGSPQIEVTGTKQWVGGATPRPTIELQLLRDGKPFGDPIALEDGHLTAVWLVDETDANGNPYTYTVDEVAVPAGYTKAIAGDGFTVVNTAIPEDPKEPETPTPPEEPEKPADPKKPDRVVTIPPKRNPKTGDAGVAPVAIGLLVLSAAGVAAVRKRRIVR